MDKTLLPPELTVSSLSQAIKRTLEQLYGPLRVRGESTGVKLHSSGHLYFRLKDTDAVIDAVAWRGSVGRWSQQLQEGMDVICTGTLTTYMAGSRYQLVVSSIEFAGEGALLKILEDRKKKLAAEGLFDGSRKKPIPFLPQRIGVITSPTGAVIQDILHRLRDRFPSHVLLWPVAVQGEGSAAQVVAALEGFHQFPPDLRPDVIIVARGGGSVEDLWSFNEEEVVRAVARATIPIVSAVGHETDTTLIDFVADRRAPTPTAAAEMVVPVRLDLQATLEALGGRLKQAMGRGVVDFSNKLLSHSQRLPEPLQYLGDRAQRLDDWSDRLLLSGRIYCHTKSQQVQLIGTRTPPFQSRYDRSSQHLDLLNHRLFNGINMITGRREEKIASLNALLESVSVQRVLTRGFCIALDEKGRHIINSVGDFKKQKRLQLRFQDGIAVAAPLSGDSTRKGPATPQEKEPSLFDDPT